jgi:hypothetical protein
MFAPSQETPMNRPPHDQRPLLDSWFAWQELPDAVRQHALDLLTALSLEIVDPPNLEPETHDSTDR